MKRIAVLMTCFNRVALTTRCLRSLFEQELPSAAELVVFLVDASSPDNTAQVVNAQFPQVRVIQGDSNLFWCSGMRLAWETAKAAEKFDAYLWLNDDVTLYPGAVSSLMSDVQKVGGESIVGGVFEHGGEMTYGGRDSRGCLIRPNGKPQLMQSGMNGNFVWIPHTVVVKMGILSDKFVHAAGDYEYGIRARRAGIKVFVSSKILGNCAHNPGFDASRLKTVGLRKRMQLLFSPKGVNIPDYFQYKKSAVGLLPAIGSYVKWISICLVPRLFLRPRQGSFQKG